jgi:hypothetical protein
LTAASSRLFSESAVSTTLLPDVNPLGEFMKKYSAHRRFPIFPRVAASVVSQQRGIQGLLLAELCRSSKERLDVVDHHNIFDLVTLREN